MSSRPAQALESLQRTRPLLGIMQTISGAAITQAAIAAGFDFVILDCQHAGIRFDDLSASLDLLQGSTTIGAVRLAKGDLAAAGRLPGLGASLLLMPEMQSANEARGFVAAARSNMEAPVRPLSLFAMIEDREGVDHADEIAGVEGIDGLIIGPNDLADDLGCPGDFTALPYQSAFQAIERAALGAGVMLGSKSHPGFPLSRLLGAGHRFILAGSDGMALSHGFDRLKSQSMDAFATAAR
jgi:4-hydroxy-2-oxoheptanedioate aldolase